MQKIINDTRLRLLFLMALAVGGYFAGLDGANSMTLRDIIDLSLQQWGGLISVVAAAYLNRTPPSNAIRMNLNTLLVIIPFALMLSACSAIRDFIDSDPEIDTVVIVTNCIRDDGNICTEKTSILDRLECVDDVAKRCIETNRQQYLKQ